MRSTPGSHGLRESRRLHRWARRLTVAVGIAVAAAMLPATPALEGAVAQAAPQTCPDPGCSVTIDARDFPDFRDNPANGQLDTFTFIVNLDNTKLPNDPLALDSESNSPIVAEGDQDHDTVTLPDGRYLVSVRSLDHKMWGAYFTLPDDAANDGTLTETVALTRQSGDNPLPLAKIRVFVFNDNAWTNGAPDTEEPGLGGFQVGLEEQTGNAVTVDYNNKPLCGGVCKSSSAAATLGFVEINDLGPATYFIDVHPPEGPCNSNPNSEWFQTTTIDGGLQLWAPTEEGADGTGAPGEQLWEPPNIRTAYWFGFVCSPRPFTGSATGEITGQARNWVEWAPYTTGTFSDPVDRPFVALSDATSDQTVFVGRGDADGNFDVQNVPAGDYNLAVWDEQLSYIMRFKPVHVEAGQTVDVNETGDDGSIGLGVSRWFGWLDGTVYKDLDGDGQYTDGVDAPIANTDMDQRWRDGSIKEGTFTDTNGHYEYPTAEGGALGRWIINEQGFARFSADPGASTHDERTGAVTPSCLVDGTPVDPCVPNSLGGALLMNQLLLEGHRATVDWGKRDYAPGTPGQIVGITYFSTTRNEFFADKQAHEDYEPGIPDVTVYLETPGPDGVPNTNDDVVVNKYVTDHWYQPSTEPTSLLDPAQDCGDFPRDFAGNELTDLNPKISPNCLEVPLTGEQTKEGAFDGGYAFADYCPGGYNLQADNGTCVGGGDPTALVAGDYIVHAEMPTDANDNRDCNIPGETQRVSEPHGQVPGGGQGCLYHIVREEDVNVDLGNNFIPQIPPPPCNGDMHIIDQASLTTRSDYYSGDAFRTDTVDTTSGSAVVSDPSAVAGDVGKFVAGPGIAPRAKIVSVGAGTFTMSLPATATATAVDVQIGSAEAPLCDKHLVVLKNGQNANADFHMMTNFRTDPNGEDPNDTRTGDVAEPGRIVGQVFNDIYFERNMASPWYGEPRPIGNIPIGVYARVDTKPNVNQPYTADNWRLIKTIHTTQDGAYEILLPSTETLNCPIPQGPCPGMYLLKVNDPGTKANENVDYNPNILTATSTADVWPGLTTQMDTPLDPISGTACEEPAGGTNPDPSDPARPELLQVSRPYVLETDSGTGRRITIDGDFIGANSGTVRLTDWRTGAVRNLTQGSGIVSWTPGSGNTPDRIVITVPAVTDTFTAGPKQLTLISSQGTPSVNGITIHVLDSRLTLPTSRTDAGAIINNGTRVYDANLSNADDNGGLNGWSVSGPGIPSGTTIVSVNFSNSQANRFFTISQPATATATNVALTLSRGTRTDNGVGRATGSLVLHDPSVVSTDTLNMNNGGLVGRTVTGTGIPAGSVVASVFFSNTPSSRTVTLNTGHVATSTGTGSVTYGPVTRTENNTTTNNGRTVLDSAIQATDAGAGVSATGIPSGTTITSVNPGVSFVMSNAATQTGTRTLTISSTVSTTPYNPTVKNVQAPTLNGHELQTAIDAASPGDLLVLAPGTYNENILLWKPVHLQGLGPGGIIGAHELQGRDPEDPRFNVPGTVIDGRFFQQNAAGFDATVAAHGSYVLPGNRPVLRGADITVVAQSANAYGLTDPAPSPLASTVARIDGLGLMTGQGEGAGGIQLQASINNMQITNNVLENNAGVVVGGIGVGQPFVDSHNYNVRIDRNRVIGNGGLTQAGGVGIFTGSNGYEVANSVMCSNFSVNYGAGISHIGLSPNGSIHDNRIYYNDSVDSGAGIAIESEVPNGGGLGDGTGSVNVDRNLIQSNFSGDDGGGVFVLDAFDAAINLRNNMIVDNGAADMGAVTIDDSTRVSIINNTIANNASTGTGENSEVGVPHSAGLASEANDPLWQAQLPVGAPHYSRPVALFNNIFWNNNAFTVDQFGPGATLISQGFIDFEIRGTTDSGDTFTPRYSDLTNGQILGSDGVLRSVPGGQGNLIGADPLFVTPFVNELAVSGSRLDPQQAAVTITGQDPPVGLTGDYHLQTTSPVIDRGAGFSNLAVPPPNVNGGTQTPNNATSILAPCSGAFPGFPADFDAAFRPYLRVNARARTPWDLGADEVTATATSARFTIPGTYNPPGGGNNVTFNWNGPGQLLCANSTVPITP